MKKKILFVLPKFEFGGTVFSTLNMISILKENYDIKVLPMVSCGPVKEYYEPNLILPTLKNIEALFIRRDEIVANRFLYMVIKLLNRICLKFNLPLSKKFYAKAAKDLMAKYHFDFVASCQEGDSTEFVSYFDGAKKIAWFRSEYSIYRTRRTEAFEKNLHDVYSRLDNIVCVSNTTRNDFAKWFTETNERTIAIHNIQNIENITKQSQVLVDDAFDSSFFNIVTVGRFSPQKRFASIPEIASQLKRSSCKFRWYIIGDGNIEIENDRFIAEQEKYQTKDCVIPIGSRLNPYPYIASADLFVITSSYEACPRVVAEAQILHTPVVSADYSSAREFVNERTNGYVDKLENLHIIISQFINNNKFYAEVKEKCNEFSSDNSHIHQQLLNLFS